MLSGRHGRLIRVSSIRVNRRSSHMPAVNSVAAMAVSVVSPTLWLSSIRELASVAPVVKAAMMSGGITLVNFVSPILS